MRRRGGCRLRGWSARPQCRRASPGARARGAWSASAAAGRPWGRRRGCRGSPPGRCASSPCSSAAAGTASAGPCPPRPRTCRTSASRPWRPGASSRCPATPRAGRPPPAPPPWRAAPARAPAAPACRCWRSAWESTGQTSGIGTARCRPVPASSGRGSRSGRVSPARCHGGCNQEAGARACPRPAAHLSRAPSPASLTPPSTAAPALPRSLSRCTRTGSCPSATARPSAASAAPTSASPGRTGPPSSPPSTATTSSFQRRSPRRQLRWIPQAELASRRGGSSGHWVCVP
mmetsp:Transcript_160752/g.390513  ORF Transcript_160752/g.390513 Transcript_160752/m.390513 type:complete len:289 (+) Transcript_160752:493-1359(+)